jgi:peptidoglycan/LPS O-acetylase OafA/YrhL
LAFMTFFPRMLQLDYVWPQWFHSFCLNFGRSLFPLATLFVVLPSILGIKGSFISTLLDQPLFNILSRFSYGAILFHGLIILYIANVKQIDTYFWISDLYVTSLAVIVLSCFFGVLMTLFVEMPCNYLSNRMLISLKSEQNAVS